MNSTVTLHVSRAEANCGESVVLDQHKKYWYCALCIPVVLKLVRAVTQIKVAIVLLPSISQWLLIIQSNIVVLVRHYLPKNRILPPEGNLPPVWEIGVYEGRKKC